jgi:hypothetical protein
MESMTTTLQEMWHDERQQIEDSWSYKMDDLRSLQRRCQEVDGLRLAIDETSEKLVRLRGELGEVHSAIQSHQNVIASIPARLDRLYEIHPKLEAQVAALLEKKKILDHQSRVLGRRHAEVEKLQEEVDALEKQAERRSLFIDRTSSRQRVLPRNTKPDFPTPEDFSATAGGEEEDVGQFTRHSFEFETLAPADSESEPSNDDPFLEEVVNAAREAIAMPLIRSQFWLDE